MINVAYFPAQTSNQQEQPASTLTKHIQAIRSQFSRAELCGAHDTKDQYISTCPAVGKSSMDVEPEWMRETNFEGPPKLLQFLFALFICAFVWHAYNS
jgi:hypothetical protein